MTQFGVFPNGNMAKRYSPRHNIMSEIIRARRRAEADRLQAIEDRRRNRAVEAMEVVRLHRRRFVRSIDAIAQEVADEYGVPLEALCQHNRDSQYVRPRQDAYWRCAYFANASMTRIGRYFGFDRATVKHGIRAHEKRRSALGREA